jgi:nucleotide-binding universal stress UspA family protein
MKKILCATDLSESSDEALRQADAYCDEPDADLTVLYVEPPLVPLPFAGDGLPQLSPGEIEATRLRTRSALDEQVARAGVRCKNLTKEIAPAVGPVHAEIVRRAEAGGFALLAVGSHGGTGLARILLGSVAEKVVQHASSSVLVARRSSKSGQIAVGSDLSAGAQVALVAAAREAARRKARLTVLHALGNPPDMMGFGYAPLVPAPPPLPESRVVQAETARERLERQLGEARVEARVVIDEGEAASGLVRLAETLSAELVVVGASSKSGIARILLGSVAQTVVRKAPCSVFVARDTSEGARPSQENPS